MKSIGASALLLAACSLVQAIQLNPDNLDEVRAVTMPIAQKMFSYYTGWRPGDNPGNLPDPYFWWECGAMFGGLIDYWHYTGDDQFNANVSQGMVHQAGIPGDSQFGYMPSNQSKQLGNDDQGFWGVAAMMAVERNFPNPPEGQAQWLPSVQAVFNTQKSRWADECNGGLKWQISNLNKGYDYKNTISNGCFFNIAARLASYTGDSEYAEWAERTWDWLEGVGYIQKPDGDFGWGVYDGAHWTEGRNCTIIDKTQWSYNAGVVMLGLAHMYNRTEDVKWKDRLDEIIDGIPRVFLKPELPNVMFEVACEGRQNPCDQDQRSFKAYLARWMGSTMQVAPHTIEKLMPIIRASAVAAAGSCTEGPDGIDCGHQWTIGQDDGQRGVSEQLTALEVMSNLFSTSTSGPTAADRGGISVSDPTAGLEADPVDPWEGNETSTGDKAGAGILTALVLAGLLGGTYWLIDPFGKE